MATVILRCTGVVPSSDKKIKAPFTVDKVYEAIKEDNRYGLRVVGDRECRGESKDFLVVPTHIKGQWLCVGIAKFVEVVDNNS